MGNTNRSEDPLGSGKEGSHMRAPLFLPLRKQIISEQRGFYNRCKRNL